jgi:3',5'-cyclic AMP phosphodiesterase CpdA
MKVHVMSDLHLEFHPVPKHWSGVYSWLIPQTDADVIVLAGDIGNWRPATRWAIRESERLGKAIIYVPGNHEWYRESMSHFAAMLEMTAAACARVHVLDRGEAVIEGARFLGATLWTDYALFGEGNVEAAVAAAQAQMNDFRVITFQTRPYRRFTPQIALRLHVEARRWLGERLAATFAGPTVVVTHHAPSNLGQQERHRSGTLAPSFASDLSALIDPSRVALWIHGHTHYCGRYEINGVPIVTNQAGYYRIEEVPGFDPQLVVDVGT